MSDYTATDKPLNGSWLTSKVIRDEFGFIERAVNSKANKNGDSSTSTTSMLIDDITQTFVMEINKEFVPNMSIIIADADNPTTNYMLGTLLAYNSTTGLSSASISSHAGSGTISSWLIGASNQSGVTLGSNTFTGYQNFARATVVSHATTSDIWYALGNQIDFTGTAIITAFPNAPQAGVVRELICASTCSFTAGANILIDGFDSGETLTCAANDVVIVRAISATQFLLTRQRYDGLAQQEQDCEIRLASPNGRGAVNTKVLRYSTEVRNVGDKMTYADSANDGASITINKSGRYGITMTYQSSSSNEAFGLSVNSNQLTTNLSVTTSTNVVAYQSVSTGSEMCTLTASRKFSTGDILRPQDDAVGTATGGAYAGINIVYLGGA